MPNKVSRKATKSNLIQKLIAIQSALNVPKGQRNKFGNYNYRSCEDILEAIKPHLKEHELLLRIDDELINKGERYYIKATAELTDGEETETRHGYAREEEKKKGMDGSQVTGAASSYAQKYALNKLFLLDDNKDSDATNKHEKTKESEGSATKEDGHAALMRMAVKLFDSFDMEQKKKIWAWLEKNFKTKKFTGLKFDQLSQLVKNMQLKKNDLDGVNENDQTVDIDEEAFAEYQKMIRRLT